MVARIAFILYYIIFFQLIASVQGASLYVSVAGNFNLPPWQIVKFDDDGSNGEVFISAQSPHLD
nr:hypothetical protein [Bacteroidota bacterium]